MGLCASLFFVVFTGGVGAVKADYKLCSSDGTWCIEPAKYTYWGEGEETVRVSTTISNQSDKECSFDLGDGNTTAIAGEGNLTYSYSVSMNGNTTRYFIVKEGQGWIREALTLKIQPFWRGGD
jgi:hypothetical protein